ncbi:hypothetical protein CHS0354_036866 [Potamilus streckersoni]|uniref:ZZ-type domain-containing protein n=1 Tax=Potamilus streckersoni TaxID=2493646 RepID=A0AAE0S103_9BIVA|nr:hypothetical protein CHS0354_036866 [Potamilus streckersoni]
MNVMDHCHLTSVCVSSSPDLANMSFIHQMMDDYRVLEDACPILQELPEYRQVITEMRAQNFDVIRFATYRTACKLRFVQRKTHLDMVDIWNIIESFRENGLNTLEPATELNASRIEGILRSIFSQLNKRVPISQQVQVDQSVSMLLHWLLSAYDSCRHGKIQVFSVKVALSHLCAGKLMDKLRYIFTQLSDSSGYLVLSKFEQYLRDVLALPTAVFEGPSFGYYPTAAQSVFDGRNPVNVNDFLNVIVSEPGPKCLMWLPILHRMMQVENVFHPVQCEGCHRDSFLGFRYRCQRCYNYQLCQDCFWRGRVSGNHATDHQMKEYTTYKSPAKQIGHTLKKSFRCVQQKDNHIPMYPEYPEKTVDLSYIVPPAPVRNGYHNLNKRPYIDVTSVDTAKGSMRVNDSLSAAHTDDEHRLIARYAARLAADAKNAARSPVELNFALDTNKAQRELIAQLETKNREIMHEIQRLRMEQEAHAKSTAEAQFNPTLFAELRVLRQRKDELEARMLALQDGRKELVIQLETLMKMLKYQPTSPRSTPHDSPHSFSGCSPTIDVSMNSRWGISSRHSTPTTAPTTPAFESSSLLGLHGDVQQAFTHPQSSASTLVKNLKNELLLAADSITGAMSSLVRELNSEQSGSDDEDDILNGELEVADNSMMQTREDLENWQKEVQKRLDQEARFIAKLRAKQSITSNTISSDPGSENLVRTDDGDSLVRTDEECAMVTDDGESYVKTDDESCTRTDEEDAELYDSHPRELQNEMSSSRYSTEEESYLQSDAESYIRTDDEEGGNTDWEESMKRWVNR